MRRSFKWSAAVSPRLRDCTRRCSRDQIGNRDSSETLVATPLFPRQLMRPPNLCHSR